MRAERVIIALLLLSFVRTTAAGDAPATAPARSDAGAAAALLAEARAAHPPTFDQDRGGDAAYVAEYRRQVEATMLRRAELAKEFVDRFSHHEQADELAQERWLILMSLDRKEQAVQEIAAAVRADPDSDLATAGGFVQAAIAIREGTTYEEKSAAVEAFIAAYPKDPRGADLLRELARLSAADDPAREAAIMRRIATEYPDSRAGRVVAGKERQSTGVGKPFELSFTDAITGRRIDVKDLRGKVVVIDFWATWCGPCIAEMPKMKQLYDQWHDKGVEFIGVSLDAPEAEGGLDALKAFVAKNDIRWPQYYQGNRWESEFSMSWGIDMVPTMFIVDAEGNLHSTSARGWLEMLIPKLIAERDGGASGN